jgi:hypothetical protein
MQTPDDAVTIGWYALGPAPGAVGPATLAAHVNLNGVQGTFARLHELKQGDEVTVRRADGTDAVFSPGQAGDNPRLVPLLDALADIGHRPAHLLADKAYSHPSTRRELRRRRIRHTIPERRDQVEHRKAKGSSGGRPPSRKAGAATRDRLRPPPGDPRYGSTRALGTGGSQRPGGVTVCRDGR